MTEVNLVHGHNRGGKRTKEYRVWSHIIGRCHNCNDASFKNYGGRGITVAQEWRENFASFLLEVGLAPTPAHTLDRINNDGNYESGNVRWATRNEQARNTSRNIVVDGLCLKDACAKAGLKYDAIQARIRRGDPISVALSEKIGHAYRKHASQYRTPAPGSEGGQG